VREGGGEGVSLILIMMRGWREAVRARCAARRRLGLVKLLSSALLDVPLALLLALGLAWFKKALLKGVRA
jgi:hypothetical protein